MGNQSAIKGKNEQNLGNYEGPTPRRSDPTPRRGMPTLRCGREEDLASLG